MKNVILLISVVLLISGDVVRGKDEVKAEHREKNVVAGQPDLTNAPFSAQASQEFMKRVAETSRKIEEIKAQIEARKAEIFQTNEEVKKLFERQIELQKKINSILEQDKELVDLKIRRDIISSIMPQTMRRRTLPANLP